MNSITCIDLEKFDDFDSFLDFIKKNKEYETLFTRSGKDYILSYHNVFYRISKLWIIDSFVISMKNRGCDEIIPNPHLDEILMEHSVDVLDRDVVQHKEKMESLEIKLDMDSILDRINEVGLGNLTKKEKDFLSKNK
jgi:hypothetical protein